MDRKVTCFGCDRGWTVVTERDHVRFEISMGHLAYYACQRDPGAVHFQDARAARFIAEPAFDELGFEVASLVASRLEFLADDFLDALYAHLQLGVRDTDTLKAFVEAAVRDGVRAYGEARRR